MKTIRVIKNVTDFKHTLSDGELRLEITSKAIPYTYAKPKKNQINNMLDLIEKNSNITHRELADKLNVSTRTIRRYVKESFESGDLS